MRVLMELTLPYCRVGGMVVTLKKGEIASEVASSLHAMEVLGGRIRESRGVDIEGLRDGRVLVVVDKVKNTPLRISATPQASPENARCSYFGRPLNRYFPLVDIYRIYIIS